MTRSVTLPLTKAGNLKLTPRLQRRFRRGGNDVVQCLDLDGSLLLLPPDLEFPRIQRRFERACRAAGVTMKDLGGPERED